MTAAPLLIMMESFLVPLLSVSLFHFPVRERVPLLFGMFLSFLPCAASVSVPLVPICISHLPVLLFTFLFIQPVVERILFTVSVLQLWNQQWNLCEQRGHKHCLCILGWKKQKKNTNKQKNHRASTALYPYNPQSAVLEEKWSSFTPRSTAKQQHLSQDAPLDRR